MDVGLADAELSPHFPGQVLSDKIPVSPAADAIPRMVPPDVPGGADLEEAAVDFVVYVQVDGGGAQFAEMDFSGGEGEPGGEETDKKEGGHQTEQALDGVEPGPGD